MIQENRASEVSGLTRAHLRELWEQSRQNGGESFQITPSVKLFSLKPERETAVFCFSGIHRAKIKSAKGFSVEIRQDGEERTYLKIESNPSQSEDLFAYVALDLIDLDCKLGDESAARRFSLITGRIKAWKAFLKDRNRRLTPSQELGLAGELFFLRKCIEHRVNIFSLQSFWTGPFRSARDFAFGSEVYTEVKTSTVPLPLRVKIDSLEQLDAASVKTLLLCVVVMRTDDSEAAFEKNVRNGEDDYRTLDDLAKEIECLLDTAGLKEEFRTLLLVAGLTDDLRKESRRRFCPQTMQFYRAECLPSLTLGKIPGIIKAVYEIEILDGAGAPTAGSEEAQIESSEAWQILVTSEAAEPPSVCDEDDDVFEAEGL